MFVCLVGDAHGALDHMFEEVLKLEQRLEQTFTAVLHVGDFGIWPDPNRLDEATRRHGGAGDFPRWLAERKEVPRKTIFIKGNHEDFAWLDAQPTREILPNLFYLPNGSVTEVSDGTDVLRIGGVGGCFGPTNFGRPSVSLQGKAKRHYTRDEIDMLISHGPIDLLLTHDAPAGVVFERHRRGPGFVSEAEGLDDLVRSLRPKVCFFGHHHTRVRSEIFGVPCEGLNEVRYPGGVAAVEMTAAGFRMVEG